LKTHGGKYYLAPQIVALMPPHTHYVEPFAGGLAVLLAHHGTDRSELVNDLNGELMNFWRVLQDPPAFETLYRRLEAVPFSRIEWEEALDQIQAGDGNPIERAASFFITCRQSLAGRMTTFAPPTRTRTRRGMNGNVSEWIGAVDGLPAVHARLRQVFIEAEDALQLIPREDTPGTLFYCDPPYLHETRVSTDAYAYEMTEAQHQEFLGIATRCEGMVMISGYESELYDTALERWTKHLFDLPNNAAGGRAKRRMTECLWVNF
jgi:DNA adenine methylase